MCSKLGQCINYSSSIGHFLNHYLVTSQKWEGAVLQLHDNTFQDWQHGCNVQKEQGDGLEYGGGREVDGMMNGMR